MKAFRYGLVVLSLLGAQPVYAKVFTPHYPEFFEQYSKQSRFNIDTTANAIILYETQNYSIMIVGAVYVRRLQVRKIIKIVTESGKENGDVHEDAYYNDKNTTNFTDLAGTTYNWLNGAITEERLDKKTAVYEVANNHTINMKFSMPAVQTGSVIDYHYTVDEPLNYSMGTAYFQEEIPKLYCAVSLDVPPRFGVTYLLHGTTSFKEYDERKPDDPSPLKKEAYKSTEKGYNGNVVTRWMMKNIHGYHDEPYLTNVVNYLDQVSFQITSLMSVSDYGMHNDGDKFDGWDKINEYYLKEDNLLKKIKPHAGYITAALPKIVGSDSGQLLQAQLIYRFVRDSFNVANKKSPESLAQVFEERSGTERDLNFLFMALLKAAGIQCNAVAISTTDNVKLTEVFPVIANINYLATLINIDGAEYITDPSQKYNSFGILDDECYNGYCRVIDEDSSYGFELDPEQLVDKSRCVVFTENADADNYILAVKHYYGEVSSPQMRKNILRNSAEIKKEILKELPSNAELVNYKAENLNAIDERLILDYEIKLHWKEPVIYMVPCLINIFSENPFKAVSRDLPVEFPFAMQFVYDLNLQLPKGYKLMDSVHAVQYDLGADNKYKYIGDYLDSANTLRVNTTLLFKQTYFDYSQYGALKTFFDNMLAVQQTPYYFKKL